MDCAWTPHKKGLSSSTFAFYQRKESSLCHQVMSLLGKSSLLNAGAIPLAMGGTAVSMVTDGVGKTIGGGASMLENLAMDEESEVTGGHG